MSGVNITMYRFRPGPRHTQWYVWLAKEFHTLAAPGEVTTTSTSRLKFQRE